MHSSLIVQMVQFVVLWIALSPSVVGLLKPFYVRNSICYCPHLLDTNGPKNLLCLLLRSTCT